MHYWAMRAPGTAREGVRGTRRSFVSLEGSDHLLTAPGQAHRAGRIIGAWADAYLGDPNLISSEVSSGPMPQCP